MPLNSKWEHECSRARDAIRDDPFAIEALDRLTGQLATAVNDPTMHRSVYRKIASAIASGLLTSFEVRELIEAVDRNATHRGKYFVVSIKRLFEQQEIPW